MGEKVCPLKTDTGCNHVLDNETDTAFGFGIDIEAVGSGNNKFNGIRLAAREFDIDIEIVLRVVVEYFAGIVANHQRHHSVVERIGANGNAVVFALNQLAVNAPALARLKWQTNRSAVQRISETGVVIVSGNKFFIEIVAVLRTR